MGKIKHMSVAKKMKNLDVDERGRITLPKELREGVDAFAISSEKDGVLILIPQRQVSVEDAKLIDSLKKSAQEYKVGKLHKMPKKWME